MLALSPIPTTNSRTSLSLLTTWILFVALQCGFCQPSHGQLVDAIRGWFRDPLVHAIDKGLKPGGDLAFELEQIGYYAIESQAHGEAILRAVAVLPHLHGQDTQAYTSVDSAVANLFLEVYDTDSPAYVLLWQRGIPELIQHYRSLRSEYDQKVRNDQVPGEEDLDDLMELLVVLARYQTREGTDCVIEAARSNLGETSYRWYSIFDPYSEGHAQSERLFAELSQPLPADNAAESLLDAANAVAAEDEDFAHPFANSGGLIRLKKWLSSTDDIDSGRAYSAAAALAYVDLPGRELLLNIAAAHRDPVVRIEAAAAAAEAGLPIGLERLVEYCKNVHTSVSAQEYLTTREQQDMIPAEALEPKFAAMAQLSNWLQYEGELGRVPDELEVLDQRQLNWLDSDEPLRMSVVRYRATGETLLDDDDIGVGVVGSMTWCFFSAGIEQLPIEDIYAVHCAFEAINQSYITEVDSSEQSDPEKALATWQQQWTGAPLEQIELDQAYRVDDDYLSYPQSTVAIARAQRDGQAGWVVFDGPRSRWYPRAEFPELTSANTILRLHIGRQLLGFPPAENRQLRSIERRKIAPETVVSEYEKWMVELNTATFERRIALFESYGELTIHFDKYVEAKAQLAEQTPDAVYLATYDALLVPAQLGNASQRAESLDALTVLGEKFDGYVERIVKSDPQRVADLIELFEPYWDYVLGRSYLANAAWQADMRDEARRILEPHVATDEYLVQGSDARIMAELWHTDGRVDEARTLLSKAIESCQSELHEIDQSDYDYDLEYVNDLRDSLTQNQTLFKQLFESP